jgi:hypothetical protein
MALDQPLLQKARAEAERFASAERHALLARTDYHTVVRRLHLSGGSLREIAQALGLSHQRVQQIVKGAGGSWWQRVWRSRNATQDAVCTFCDRPSNEVAKLIAGPNVYICDACVTLAEKAVAGAPGRGPLVIAKGAAPRCSFCRRFRKGTGRPIVAGAASNICGECVRICRQILDDRAG